MSQVTIYLEDDALAAAKEAAARAHMSLSKWFAQFAEAEKRKPKKSWDEFFAEVDKRPELWADFPLTEEMNKDLPPDTPRETW